MLFSFDNQQKGLCHSVVLQPLARLSKALRVVFGPINDVLVIEFLPSYAYSHLCSILMYLTIIKTLGLWSLRTLIIIPWNLEAEHRFRKHLWCTYHVANNWQCLSLPSPLPPPSDLRPLLNLEFLSVVQAVSSQIPLAEEGRHRKGVHLVTSLWTPERNFLIWNW